MAFATTSLTRGARDALLQSKLPLPFATKCNEERRHAEHDQQRCKPIMFHPLSREPTRIKTKRQEPNQNKGNRERSCRQSERRHKIGKGSRQHADSHEAINCRAGGQHSDSQKHDKEQERVPNCFAKAHWLKPHAVDALG